jgi:ankyrin repeat protein
MIQARVWPDYEIEARSKALLAAEAGDCDVLRCIHEQAPNVLKVTKNKYGWKPVHFAAYNGHLRALTYLVDTCGCNPDVQERHRWSPVFAAAWKGHLDIVKYLLMDKHCKRNIRDHEGRNLLHSAAMSGNFELVKFLVDTAHISPSTTKDGKTVLFTCATSGNLHLLKWLLERYSLNSDQWDQNKLERPVVCAAEGGHFEMVKHLLENCKCDPFAKNVDGYTLLHDAACGGNTELFDWIVNNYKMDVHEWNNNKSFNAILLAVRSNRKVMVDHLISKYHCDPKTKGMESTTERSGGWTLLHTACRYGYTDIAKELMDKYKMDPHDVKNDGSNAVQLAVIGGHIDLVREMVDKHGAALDYKDVGGNTAVLHACTHGHKELLTLLVDQYKCSPKERQAEGNSAVMLAAKEGHLPVFRVLVTKYGCSVRDTRNVKHCSVCVHTSISLYIHQYL